MENNEEKKEEKKELTAEELAASVESLTKKVNELTDQLTKQKSSTEKASSDAAEWKRKFRETQSEADKAKADNEEELNSLREKVATYEKQSKVYAFKSAYIGMGYTEELAVKRAELMADGKLEEAMAVEKEFLTAHDRELTAAGVRGVKKPESGTHRDGAVTLDAFKNMGITERVKFKQEHPDQYAEFTKK